MSKNALAKKVFRGSIAIKRGLVTRAALRSSAWRRLFRDVYADATLPDSHQLRCQAASAFLLPAGAAIAGRSAAHLLGGLALRAGDPVEILTPRGFGPVSGLVIHRGTINEVDGQRYGRHLVTTPKRTSWDLARWLDVVEAVIAIDVLLRSQPLDLADLADYARQRAGLAGYSRLLQVVELADGASESPQESRLRVGLVLAGLPKPVVQHNITRDGRFVARVDLAWPQLRIAVEYDGRWHASTAQFEADRARLNRLLGADWVVFHVTAVQLRHGLGDLVNEIRAAMRKRSSELQPAKGA